MAQARKHVVPASPDFTIPQDKIKILGTQYSKSEHVEDCVGDYEATWIEVRVIYDIALQLRESIREAASKQLLDTSSLKILETKLSSMQEEFTLTCVYLSKPRESLLLNVKSTT
jgi:hypothetical protein